MPYGEDKTFCLVRFLGLLIQTSDTSDLFYTFNILKFKKACTKRSYHRNTAECKYLCNGCLVTLGSCRAGSRKHSHTATPVALETRILQD